MRALRLVPVVLVLGCSGSLVDRNGGAGVARLDAAGGSVELTELGVRLTVPPGALSEAVTVSIGAAPSAPGGGLRAIGIAPDGLALAAPATLSYLVEQATPADDELAVARGGRWEALPGRILRPLEGTLDTPIHAFGTFAVIESNEICDNGVDDDADGLVDCVDPVCTGRAGCPGACATDATCPCGSTCVQGQCALANLTLCASDADCPAAFSCQTPASNGQSCGFTACLPRGGTTSGADGGSTVATCLSADPCLCPACTDVSQCASGIPCVEAKRKGVSCGFNVCSTAP
jgi:hypothetical protein